MAATGRGFRQLLLDIHLYLSLALGLVIVAVAVTGAPLVWRDQVDRFLNPDRYAISGAEIRLTPSGYVANALAAAPSAEFYKAMQLFATVSQPAMSGATMAIAARR